MAWIAARSAARPFDVQAWPVLAILAWNVVMTVLAALNVRLIFHRYLNAAADLIFDGPRCTGPRVSQAWRRPGLGLLPVLNCGGLL